MKSLLARAGLDGAVHVESAGTADYHTGELPDGRSRAAAKGRGMSLASRAQQFVPSFFERFDYVLAMDAQNLEDLKRIAPSAGAREKIRLLRSFDPASPPDAPVPDPYHGGADGFEEVLDLCQVACEGLVGHLRRAHSL